MGMCTLVEGIPRFKGLARPHEVIWRFTFEALSPHTPSDRCSCGPETHGAIAKAAATRGASAHKLLVGFAASRRGCVTGDEGNGEGKGAEAVLRLQAAQYDGEFGPPSQARLGRAVSSRHEPAALPAMRRAIDLPSGVLQTEWGGDSPSANRPAFLPFAGGKPVPPRSRCHCYSCFRPVLVPLGDPSHRDADFNDSTDASGA